MGMGRHCYCPGYHSCYIVVTLTKLFTDMKMSQFVGTMSGGHYTYVRDGKEHTIASGLLTSLFKTHGYCIDPSSKNGLALNIQSIETLKQLAINNNDQSLSNTLKAIGNGKAPSPRMTNDNVMHETTLNEKHRFDHLSVDNKTETLSILRTILNIGLYLAGWKGGEEPYLTSPRKIHDIVRIELKVSPLIQSLYTDPNYPLVKNFPIMGYYYGGPTSAYTLKPSVMDTSLNVDRCLNRISLGLNENHIQVASYLISTAYYYITTVCHTPVPMIEPLIMSLASKGDAIDSKSM
jgi:hypothetical protein